MTLFWSQSGHCSYTERPDVTRNCGFSVWRYEIKPFSVWQSANGQPNDGLWTVFRVSAKSTPAQPLAAARYFAAGDTSVGFTPIRRWRRLWKRRRIEELRNRVSQIVQRGRGGWRPITRVDDVSPIDAIAAGRRQRGGARRASGTGITGRSRTIAPYRMAINELCQGFGGSPHAIVGVTHFVDLSIAAVDCRHKKLRFQVERAQAQTLVLAN